MKKISFKVLAFALIIFMSGCADLDEINKNPNKSTDMNPNLLIPTIQFMPSYDWHAQNRYFIFPGGFMNQWTGSWAVVEYGGYAQKQASYNDYLWITYYPDLIKNIVDVVERTKDNPEYINTFSMAQVMKVQAFQRLTDYYGDVPYSEAGKGYLEGILNPKYDKQEDIYTDFLKILKEAAASFDSSASKPEVDFYYNGDMAKWRKLANSLRLRVAMRLVKINPTLAASEAKDAIDSGVFTSNDDICYVKYENVRNPGTGTGTGNGVSNFLYGDDVTGSINWLTTDLIKVMEDMNDPRIRYYGGVFLNDDRRTDITNQVLAQRGSYAAMTVPAQMFSYEFDPENPYPGSTGSIDVTVNGRVETVGLGYSRLRPSKLVEAYDAPFIYLSYAEVEFLQAEAAVRGWISTSAAGHYQKGLEAAVDQWSLFGATVDAAAVSAFSAANMLASGQELEQINTQLWVLNFLDPFETWANWRRSGYPDLRFRNFDPTKNQSNGQIPRRMQYPLEEQMKNTDNLKEAVQRLGGTDDWMLRVWWDRE